jgi:hypothetical protein
MIEFTAPGSPKAVAQTIEECAKAQRSVTALVVPWESDATTVNMAVTSVKTAGWAIEHTNLGTIRLTGLTDDRTRVSFAAGEPDHPEKQQLAALFDRFAKHVLSQFQAEP